MNKQKQDKSVLLKPNQILQPIQSKLFRIIGHLFENQNEKTHIEKNQSLRSFVLRFSKMFSGILGSFILFSIIIGAFIIPFFAQNYREFNIPEKNLKPFENGHIFGTNYLGQDIWSMIWHGLRFSLLLSLVVAILDLFIGVFFGVLSGFFEKFDHLFQNFILVLQNTPSLLILILVSLIFGPSFWIFALSFAATGWISTCLQVRAQVKRAKNFQWVEASRVLGTKKSKIMFNFLPILIPILVVQLTFTIPGVIASEVGLAFLGLKMQDQATLGTLIEEGQKFITIYPRLILIPSTFLVLIIVSVQFMGNSLESALRRTR